MAILLTTIPTGFEVIAKTGNAPICAIFNAEKKMYGVQFHPEVHHTTAGKAILDNFVRKICNCKENWTAQSFIGTAIEQIKSSVGSGRCDLCIEWGELDSTVLAVFAQQGNWQSTALYSH